MATKRPHSPGPDDEERQTRRRVSAFNYRPQGIGEYYGRSIGECRDFLAKCEVAFQFDTGVFLDDAKKVVYAVQFLRGEVATSWEKYEMDNGKDVTLWDEFSAWLANLASSREHTTALRIERAKPLPSQIVGEFVNQLESLEAELAPLPEEVRGQFLLAKLREEFREAITSDQSNPADLLARALLLEQSGEGGLVPKRDKLMDNRFAIGPQGKSKLSPKSSQKPNGEERAAEKAKQKNLPKVGGKPQDGVPGGPSRAKITQEERDRRRSQNLCYKCGRAGHFAAQCWQKADAEAMHRLA
jgi:hypothetical protein